MGAGLGMMAKPWPSPDEVIGLHPHVGELDLGVAAVIVVVVPVATAASELQCRTPPALVTSTRCAGS